MFRAGVPRAALSKALSSDRIALSVAVYLEIADVLNRPKLARFVDPDLREDVLRTLYVAAQWFEPVDRVTDCRDIKDNKYLELLLVSGAAVLVSGDEDLLVLDPWRGRRVVRPADYLAMPSA
jgi:putative PIN family toxin of toxin-antitoxin system